MFSTWIWSWVCYSTSGFWEGQPWFFPGVGSNMNFGKCCATHWIMPERQSRERAERAWDRGWVTSYMFFLLLFFFFNFLMTDESSCYDYNSWFPLSMPISANNKQRGCCGANTSLSDSILFHHSYHLQLAAQRPGLWMAARLEGTLFWYRPHCFCCVNQVGLMLTSWHLNEKAERSVFGAFVKVVLWSKIISFFSSDYESVFA